MAQSEPFAVEKLSPPARGLMELLLGVNTPTGVLVAFVHDVVETPVRLEIRVRVHNESAWLLELVRRLLVECLDQDVWQLHVCQQYTMVTREQMGYFWNLMISAKEEQFPQVLTHLTGLVATMTPRLTTHRQPVTRPSTAEPRRSIGGVVKDGLVVSVPLWGGAERNASQVSPTRVTK